MFEKIKMFYDKGIYTQAHVMAFCTKGVITREQYNAIVESR